MESFQKRARERRKRQKQLEKQLEKQVRRQERQLANQPASGAGDALSHQPPLSPPTPADSAGPESRHDKSLPT